jgi:hypothetical protein
MIRELSWAVCENFTNRNIAQAFEHVARWDYGEPG